MGGFSYVDPGPSGLDLFGSSLAQGIVQGQNIADQREAEQRRRAIQDREMAMKEEDFKSTLLMRNQQMELNKMLQYAQGIENEILDATKQDVINQKHQEYQNVLQQAQILQQNIDANKRAAEREGRAWTVDPFTGKQVYNAPVGSLEAEQIEGAQMTNDAFANKQDYMMGTGPFSGAGLSTDLQLFNSGKQPSAPFFAYGFGTSGRTGSTTGSGTRAGAGAGTGTGTKSSGKYLVGKDGRPIEYTSHFKTMGERKDVNEWISIVEGGADKKDKEGNTVTTVDEAKRMLEIYNVDPSTGLMLSGTYQGRRIAAKEEQVKATQEATAQTVRDASAKFQGALGKDRAVAWNILTLMESAYNEDDPVQVATYQKAKDAYVRTYGSFAGPSSGTGGSPPSKERKAGAEFRKSLQIGNDLPKSNRQTVGWREGILGPFKGAADYVRGFFSGDE